MKYWNKRYLGGIYVQAKRPLPLAWRFGYTPQR